MRLMMIVLAALLTPAGATEKAAAPLNDATVSDHAPASASGMEAVYRKNQQAMEQWLEKSTSPRDWALASQLIEGLSGDNKAARHRAGQLLQKAADAAPHDRLILWLWSLQPSENQGCATRSECTRRALALAWLEPGNAAADVWQVTDAWARKDPHGLDAAIATMARASHYDDAFGASFRAWQDAVLRYPRFQTWRPSTETISVDLSGASVPIAQWKTPPSMDDIDKSAAGVAWTLMNEQPLRPHFQLARVCDRLENPAADPKRFEQCGIIGRMMLAESSFFLERNEGALVLLASGTQNASDIAIAGTLRWQWEKFTQLNVERDAVALARFLAAYDATNNEMGAIQTTLQQSGISLSPPATWRYIRDGKENSPLGQWHPKREK